MEKKTPKKTFVTPWTEVSKLKLECNILSGYGENAETDEKEEEW